ncbi:MAG TPA: hypothetical protein DCE71_07565 [Parachlamydiales bacterium]|nr:hypothetical protein [Parachlamydiales bacterium]
MPTLLEQEVLKVFENADLQQNLPQYYRKIIREFRKTTKNFALFNVSFAVLITTELTLFCAFLPSFGQSYLLAIGLGAIFLTCFSYFVLLFYFQAKKPEQITLTRDRFIASCKQIIGLPPGAPQHHLSVASALIKLSAYLHDFEWHVYHFPKWLRSSAPFFTRWAAYCHWQDVFNMKQSLLHAAIEEHLEQIKATPTDLEVHASLASTYVALSQIYLEPKKKGAFHPRIHHYQKKQAFFEEKFRKAAKLAIEEFQILSHYAPNDPWVHEQLAVGYKDLQLPQEEIREVEILLQLKPGDNDTLFRLGTLYFEQGQNAKGLQAYEKLKKARYKQADHLISSYGSVEK